MDSIKQTMIRAGEEAIRQKLTEEGIASNSASVSCYQYNFMNAKEIDDMPKALRLLAEQIDAPDHVPGMCLRDAAAMIESLRLSVADAIRRPMGVVPESCDWITSEELYYAELRRPKDMIPKQVSRSSCDIDF
jgi:hypothetical protein